MRAIAETNGVVYIGGQFEYISPVSQTGRAFDRSLGTASARFPQFAGAIKTILNDELGGWFVGGQFTAVGGYPVTNLAHVRADMTLDTNWMPHPNGVVLALAREGSRLFAGGTFTEVGGEPHSLLAALDPGTGTPLDWRADCTTRLPSPSVNALVVTNGVLYIGGFFSSINGTNREHIGAVSSTSGEVTDWFPNDYNGSQISTRIDAMAIAGNLLYVGGTFASIGGNTASNGPPRPFAAALDVTRTSNNVAPWNPGADGPVTAITIECDTVYLAGKFTRVAGQTRRHLAAVSVQTGDLKPWNPDANGDVLCLAHAGNHVFVGGKFTQIGGQPRNFAAAVDPVTGEATFWNPNADFGVTGIAVSGGTVVTGGLLGPGGKARKNVAAFEARTGKPLDWAPDVSGNTMINAAPVEGVYAIAASKKAIYLGGPFTTIDGEPRNHIGAVDPKTGALLPWNPGASGTVEALSAYGSIVYAGGQFTEIGGAARTNIAAISTRTGAATKWNPGANNKVTTIARSGSTVYLGGAFTRIRGESRNRLAALNAATGRLTRWNPDAADVVSSLALSRSRVYAAGVFRQVGGRPRHHLAEILRTTGEPTCWDPDVELILRAETRYATVNAIALGRDAAYLGGSFTEVDGDARNYVAAVELGCPAGATPWSPEVDDTTTAIVARRNAIFVGGQFKTIGGKYRPSFAVFSVLGSPEILVQPEGTSVGSGSSITLSASAVGDAPLACQWQFNGTNIAGATELTLTLNDVQAEQAGEYVIVITNRLGLINSRPAIIEVVQPLTITAHPQSQTTTPGSTVVLAVEAAAHPPPIYQWRLNGVNIPGAVKSTYVISNAAPQDGGSYEVVVENSSEGLVSESAIVIVTSPTLPFADGRENAQPLPGVSGAGSGSNVGATNSPDERHANKPGGSSVWVTWTAPADGVAIFSTHGSTFDTLLGIYTNRDGTLGEVTSDEDAGGFQTSHAAFSAGAGLTYWIAVDGFAGATGHIVLTWNFEPGFSDVPRFVTQPRGQSVFTNNSVSFESQASASSQVNYQWFKNCDVIPGATNATLTLPSVTYDDVANYRVVAIAGTNIAESAIASLEIGPVPNAITYDKLEDLLAVAEAEEAAATAPRKKDRVAFAAGLSGQPTAFVPVVAGSISAQRLNNSGSRTQRREPLICGVLGGASRWFGLRATSSGTLEINTLGSRIDTLLSAYRRTNLLALHTNRLDCNDNASADVLWSSVRVPVTRGQDILVTVDGVNRQQGLIVLNWTLLNDGPNSLITPAPRVAVVPVIPLSLVRSSNQQQLSLVIRPGTNRYVIESSTNLLHWTPLQTNPAQEIPILWPISSARRSTEFFRIVPDGSSHR